MPEKPGYSLHLAEMGRSSAAPVHEVAATSAPAILLQLNRERSGLLIRSKRLRPGVPLLDACAFFHYDQLVGCNRFELFASAAHPVNRNIGNFVDA
jgi:hypothetical protein